MPRLRRRHVVHVHFRRLGAGVCGSIWGKRVGYPAEKMAPHSVVLSLSARACCGWLVRIQCGLGARLPVHLATSAFVNTHLGAASAAIGWMIAMDPARQGKRLGRHLGGRSPAWLPSPPLRASCSPCHRCSSACWPAWVCYTMVAVVKQRFGYDDSLDAFGVHGVGGTLGALLPAFLLQASIIRSSRIAAGKTLPWVSSKDIGGHWQPDRRHPDRDCAISGRHVDIAEAGRSRYRAAHVTGRRRWRAGCDPAWRRGIRLGLDFSVRGAGRQKMKRSSSRPPLDA